MFSERKPKFRSRKLDHHKALPVYRFDEVEDLEDFDSPLRTVVQVATGVDKEEEEEHHLQQALSHQSTKTQPYYIPTPEASKLVASYEKLYPSNYKQPKTYLKTLATEDPLQKSPRYNADQDDEKFLEDIRKKEILPMGFDLTLFEWIIDCLEDAAHRYSEAVVSSESIDRLGEKFAKALPSEHVINVIIEYWRKKRAHKQLISHLKHEDLGKLGTDPYVCFRRRELKLPRKTRRSDAQIVERMRKFHLDLSTTRLLLQAAIKRDRYKREALMLEGELFERYRLIDNWRIHNKSTWPSNIPNFKAAAQSLLEPKKKKARTAESQIEASELGGYKIAIPVSALRASKHARPYYPHELGKQIQRDLEAILGPGHEELGSHHRSDANSVEDICPIPEDWTGQTFSVASWWDGRLASCRVARGNRLVIDRMSGKNESSKASMTDDFADPNRTTFLAKTLSGKDFVQLQTPVGNYNVFAVQTANQILRPMSFQAWVAATAPLMTSLTSGGRPKSPKKKKARTNSEEKEDKDGEDGRASEMAGATPTNGSEMSKLSSPGTANKGQITVKMKSQATKESRKGTNARFTPHGLTPESVDVK